MIACDGSECREDQPRTQPAYKRHGTELLRFAEVDLATCDKSMENRDHDIDTDTGAERRTKEPALNLKRFKDGTTRLHQRHCGQDVFLVMPRQTQCLETDTVRQGQQPGCDKLHTIVGAKIQGSSELG